MTTDQPDGPGRQLDPSEAVLLRRIRDDDLDAFGTFFERYRGPIFATAYALLGERQAAEGPGSGHAPRIATPLSSSAACRTAGPAVLRALDHLERCRRCEAELATTRVLHALRCLHAEALRAEPAADGWSRLQERLAITRRRPSFLLSGMPGMLVAVGLCGALAGPLLVNLPASVYDEGAPGPSRTSPAIVFEQASDRRPDSPTIPILAIPAIPATDGMSRPDDLARAIAGLHSVPPERPGVDAPESGSQAAPMDADRR